MNTSNISHGQFLNLMSDEEQKGMIKSSSKVFIDLFEERVKNKQIDTDKEKAFISAILEEARSNFYMQFNDEMRVFLLFKRNFKGLMIIGHNTPKPNLKDYLNGQEHVLELIVIHSSQKGEGHKMIKRLLNLSKKLKLPITLWTESDENVLYFEKYGFENKGQLGDNNEFLMVLPESK